MDIVIGEADKAIADASSSLRVMFVIGVSSVVGWMGIVGAQLSSTGDRSLHPSSRTGRREPKASSSPIRDLVARVAPFSRRSRIASPAARLPG
jgi:hypothetical protein